jgi:hypothetical protein
MALVWHRHLAGASQARRLCHTPVWTGISRTARPWNHYNVVMSARKPDYWFPVKKRGLGWGPPNCWHGWVALFVWIAFTAAIAVAAVPFAVRTIQSAPASVPVLFKVALTVAAFFLITFASAMSLFWWKGQKPVRWRWGDETGLCPQCQYNLTGNTSGICPECGHKIET